MCIVEIPPALQKLTGGESRIEVRAGDLREAINVVDNRFAGFADKLLHNLQLRRYVSVFVDDEDVRFELGLETRLSERSQVCILIAVAGG